MNAVFVDFDDSFSFNVIQELEELGLSVTVLHWLDFDELPKTDLLVLGPGPGHPDDYQRIFPLLKDWMEAKKPLLGICLGHQLYWRILGEEVIRSKEPLHGQKIELQLTAEWKKSLELQGNPMVQRYNSLSIMGQVSSRYPHLQTFVQDGEILITKGERVLTYQFHPESVGTTCPRSFFLPVLSIMG